VAARASLRLLGLGLAASLAASPSSAAPSSGRDLKDLYFGEALFHADQGHYFDALQRLDTELGQYHGLDEPQLDSLHYHIGAAEFDVGDFELNYRMHHRAGRAIRAVLEGNVDEAVRNEAAFRLARIHFQKDQPEDALHALDRIKGEVPDEIRSDLEFLRANVYMALGRPGEAVEVLRPLQRADELTGFAAYNLGIALLQDGRTQEAIEQLDRAGQVAASERGAEAIRDKANLILGSMLFESADYARAYQSLDRVRLEGPFSNQALLRAGWSEATAGNYERALVPWNILAKREVTDLAVQDALLAAPFAYSKMNVHGRAALMYGHALEAYTKELDRLDASIDSIRKGRFLKALLREELKQDRDWVIRLRTLPETPETYYLMALLASHDFQTALSNYLDLEDLRTRLSSWETSFDAFDDIIELRRQNYEPLLPEIDAQFRELDSQIRLRVEQRQHLEKRLQGRRGLVSSRPHICWTRRSVSSC
jgi:tetratricopeptide (TPR) repeat protein